MSKNLHTGSLAHYEENESRNSFYISGNYSALQQMNVQTDNYLLEGTFDPASCMSTYLFHKNFRIFFYLLRYDNSCNVCGCVIS
jgi:hypothetical protein